MGNKCNLDSQKTETLPYSHSTTLTHGIKVDIVGVYTLAGSEAVRQRERPVFLRIAP